MHRRYFFLSTLAAGAAWSYAVEPRWFDLTRTRISLPGVRPTRILHISDIHMSDGMQAPELERALLQGLAENPHLICLTGDFVSTTRGFDRAGLTRFLQRAAAAAPCYAVLGNHDGGRWLAQFSGDPTTGTIRTLIESAGVTVLHNRAILQGELALTGLADLWSGAFDSGEAFDDVPQAAARIVLCHNPDGKDRLTGHHWDLMLSGHTHGGQAHVPGVPAFWAPVRDHRFISGLYAWNNRQLFITRGLGSPKHLRVLCRPELSLLEINATSGA